MRPMQSLLLLLLSMFAAYDSFAQDIPLVYDVEDTGAKYRLYQRLGFEEVYRYWYRVAPQPSGKFEVKGLASPE